MSILWGVFQRNMDVAADQSYLLYDPSWLEVLKTDCRKAVIHRLATQTQLPQTPFIFRMSQLGR